MDGVLEDLDKYGNGGMHGTTENWNINNIVRDL